jgi:hypothetical protein
MKLVPLTLEGVEEGRFLAHANDDLGKVMQQLTAYVKKHGKDVSKGARAELNMKITLKFEGKDLADYSIKSATSMKMPNRPAEVSVAIGERDQTGEETLFVRPSGSDHASPRQKKFATEDGRPIKDEAAKEPEKKDGDKKKD